MTWVFVQSAIDMYAPGYGKTHFGPVGGVFVMGVGLLVLGIQVAALSTISGGREFFPGKTLFQGPRAPCSMPIRRGRGQEPR